MRNFWTAGLALVSLLSMAVPALARGERVAVVPAPVVKGAPENGRVVTEAIRSDLQRHGFRLVPPSEVEAVLRRERLGTSRILTAKDLVSIRQATGADYVVYPRVLSVGVGVNSEQYQGNVLVNVGGKSPASFVHTRQVGQVFRPTAREADKAVLGRSDAEQAADKLLQGFYEKTGS